jgi:hypothetical protein
LPRTPSRSKASAASRVAARPIRAARGSSVIRVAMLRCEVQ